jgi:uncharacterized membrane protein YeaQ/YmgE (transglycosylase-associated protein family)
MGVLGWIVFGLVVGIVAKFLMPGRDPGGFVVTVLLGIVGALLGEYLGRGLGYREGDADGSSGRDHRAGRLPAVGPKGAALAQARARTPVEVRTLMMQLAEPMAPAEVEPTRRPGARVQTRPRDP